MKSRVLLAVDDNPGDLGLLKESFNELCDGVDLVTLSNGPDALAFLDSFKDDRPIPDLMFLDLNMPLMSGITVLSTIRQQAQWNSMPIFILTSSSQESEIDDCYRLGADEFIIKPDSFDGYLNLVIAVRDYLLVGKLMSENSEIRLKFKKNRDGTLQPRKIQATEAVEQARMKRILSITRK